MGCNYLSLPEIIASGNKVLFYTSLIYLGVGRRSVRYFVRYLPSLKLPEVQYMDPFANQRPTEMGLVLYKSMFPFKQLKLVKNLPTLTMTRSIVGFSAGWRQLPAHIYRILVILIPLTVHPFYFIELIPTFLRYDHIRYYLTLQWNYSLRIPWNDVHQYLNGQNLLIPSCHQFVWIHDAFITMTS